MRLGTNNVGALVRRSLRPPPRGEGARGGKARDGERIQAYRMARAFLGSGFGGETKSGPKAIARIPSSKAPLKSPVWPNGTLHCSWYDHALG